MTVASGESSRCPACSSEAKASDKVPHGGDAAAGLQIPDEACHGAVVPRGGLLSVLQQLLLQGKLEFGLSCFHRRILSAC